MFGTYLENIIQKIFVYNLVKYYEDELGTGAGVGAMRGWDGV